MNLKEIADIEDLLGQLAFFLLSYGISSYFAFFIGSCIANGDDDYDNGRPVKVVYGLDFKLFFIPIITVLVFFWILGKLFGEKGTTVAGGIVLVASFLCLLSDIIGIIRSFTGAAGE